MTAFVNNVKTALLLGALFGLLVWVGSIWGVNGMIIAGAFAVVMNFGAYFASDKIAIATMRGQPVTNESDGLYQMVKRLSAQAGLPMPRVYVCPQEAPNAFATGRNPRHAAVAVTRGALQLLDRSELEGVVAHELAHVKNRDTLTSTIAATVAGIFSMLAYGAFWFGMGNRQGGHPLAGIAVILLGSIGAALIKAMISRSREFVADADGAKIAGTPDGLVSALQKLDAYSKRIPMRNPNPAMNNLFIVEPFAGKALTSLFATHPPTEAPCASAARQLSPSTGQLPQSFVHARAHHRRQVQAPGACRHRQRDQMIVAVRPADPLAHLGRYAGALLAEQQVISAAKVGLPVRAVGVRRVEPQSRRRFVAQEGVPRLMLTAVDEVPVVQARPATGLLTTCRTPAGG